LAGAAFETLSENRWSRRDCTEYQEELDWAMRTFRRVYDEVDVASMPVKMRRVARARLDRVNHEYSGPQGSWRGSFRRTEDARRRGVRWPVVVIERSRSIGTTSAPDAPPTKGWSTRTPFLGRGGRPCR
jgi:hypothetical protein